MTHEEADRLIRMATRHVQARVDLLLENHTLKRLVLSMAERIAVQARLLELKAQKK